MDAGNFTYQLLRPEYSSTILHFGGPPGDGEGGMGEGEVGEGRGLEVVDWEVEEWEVDADNFTYQLLRPGYSSTILHFGGPPGDEGGRHGGEEIAEW